MIRMKRVDKVVYSMNIARRNIITVQKPSGIFRVIDTNLLVKSKRVFWEKYL